MIVDGLCYHYCFSFTHVLLFIYFFIGTSQHQTTPELSCPFHAWEREAFAIPSDESLIVVQRSHTGGLQAVSMDFPF